MRFLGTWRKVRTRLADPEATARTGPETERQDEGCPASSPAATPLPAGQRPLETREGVVM